MGRVQGWHTAIKPNFEVLSLERKTRGASVPLPKTIIRYILNAVLPRVLQRKLLGALPTELGHYLLEAGEGARLAGKPLLSLCVLLLHVSMSRPCLAADITMHDVKMCAGFFPSACTKCKYWLLMWAPACCN